MMDSSEIYGMWRAIGEAEASHAEAIERVEKIDRRTRRMGALLWFMFFLLAAKFTISPPGSRYDESPAATGLATCTGRPA